MSGAIDYEAAKRRGPALKAKITRAIKSGDRAKVLQAVIDNIIAWDAIGFWPDYWSSWQRAIDGVFRWPAGPSVDDIAIQVRVHGVTKASELAEGVH